MIRAYILTSLAHLFHLLPSILSVWPNSKMLILKEPSMSGSLMTPFHPAVVRDFYVIGSIRGKSNKFLK